MEKQLCLKFSEQIHRRQPSNCGFESLSREASREKKDSSNGHCSFGGASKALSGWSGANYITEILSIISFDQCRWFPHKHLYKSITAFDKITQLNQNHFCKILLNICKKSPAQYGASLTSGGVGRCGFNCYLGDAHYNCTFCVWDFPKLRVNAGSFQSCQRIMKII